uniref:Chitin-binding type-2 domain-containing protein n=1 Tax=Heterorhabditis bacteriophora TaxID=37862 RepID=A0A1I7XIX1_HETBA
MDFTLLENAHQITPAASKGVWQYVVLVFIISILYLSAEYITSIKRILIRLFLLKDKLLHISKHFQIGTCLAPLVFNPANGKCDLITNIDYCQSEVNHFVTDKLIDLSMLQYFKASSSVTSAAVFQAFAHSTINCEGRSFGWYAISPCSPEWLRCTANGATRGNCWNGRVMQLKFNCYSANVAGCNVTPQLPSQLYRVSSETSFLPAIKHATPNYEKQVFQPIQQGTSDYSSLNIFCQEKDDGIYQLGCHASYVVCSDRSTYPFNCPDGMVYNQIKSVCDLPERVSECTTNKLLQQFRA